MTTHEYNSTATVSSVEYINELMTYRSILLTFPISNKMQMTRVNIYGSEYLSRLEGLGGSNEVTSAL
jgi:hypothetical protein